MQLAVSITEKLKKYVTDPRVTVVVTQMNSQRFYVTGEVLHTGAMPLLPNMTVLQALASAGFTQFANLKGMYLLRLENGKQNRLPINYKALVKGEAVNQNILLKPGDTIVTEVRCRDFGHFTYRCSWHWCGRAPALRPIAHRPMRAESNRNPQPAQSLHTANTRLDFQLRIRLLRD